MGLFPYIFTSLSGNDAWWKESGVFRWLVSWGVRSAERLSSSLIIVLLFFWHLSVDLWKKNITLQTQGCNTGSRSYYAQTHTHTFQLLHLNLLKLHYFHIIQMLKWYSMLCFLKETLYSLIQKQSLPVITYDPLEMCGGVYILRHPALHVYFLISLIFLVFVMFYGNRQFCRK